MADLNITGEVVVSADKAEAAFTRVGARAEAMAKGVADSAGKAGKAVDGIGAGAEKGAEKFTRSEARVRSEIQKTTLALENLGKTASQRLELKIDTKGLDRAKFEPFLADLRKMEQATQQVESRLGGLSAAAGVAGRALAVIGISASIGEFVRMADASTNVASRLGLVTTSTAQLASVQQRLFEIAQSSRVSFVDLVGTYAQVARSTKDLGVSQTALLGVIQTISQAVTISGGSAASAQAALMQLSQGFASGALRGEELNSILEQTPRLAQALADGLGVGVGKLRELGQAGELTAEKVLGALGKAAPSVQAEFEKMAVTVEQASTNAANSAMKLVGVLDKITGASSSAAGGITRLSAGMDGLSAGIERLSGTKNLSDFFFAAFNNERSLNAELEITQKELTNLEARLARAPSDIYTRSAVVEMRQYVKEIKEAQTRLAALSGQGGASDYDNRPEDARLAAGAREAARQAKLREDANSFLLKQSGVPDSYIKDMTELIRLNQEGVIVGKAYTDALKKQQDVLLQKTGVTKGVAAAIGQEQGAYQSLIASIRAKVEEDKLELAGGAALTESQRMRIKLDQDLAAGRVKLNSAHEKSVRAAIAEKAATEAQVLTMKALEKASSDATLARRKESEGIEEWMRAQEQAAQKALDSVKDRITSLKDEEDAVSLSRAQNVSLAEAVEMVAIARLREKQAGFYENSEGWEQIEREIAARKELLKLIGSKSAREASDKAAEDARKAWEQTADEINRSLTDALLRGFESGKGFAENLRDTLKNMFNTLVLRPVISAIVTPVAGGITAMLGLSGGGGAAGGSGALGMASNALSAYRAGSQLYTLGGQYLGGTMSGANALGTAYANYAGGGLDALLATNGAYGTASGAGAGASAGMSGLAGAGAFLAAAAVVANAFGAFASNRIVGGGLQGTLGGDDLSTYQLWRTGGTLFGGPSYRTQDPAKQIAEYQAELDKLRDSGTGASSRATFLQDQIKFLNDRYGADLAQGKAQSDAIQAAYKAMRAGVGDMADVLGLDSSRVRNYTMAVGSDVIHPDTGGQGIKFDGLDEAGIQKKIQEALATANNALAEQVIGSWVTTTETVRRTLEITAPASGDSTFGLDGEYRQIEETVTSTHYVASEFARDGENAIATLTRLATSLTTVNSVFEDLGTTLYASSLAGGDMASQLIDLFGNADNFRGAASTYLQNFYSQDEQRAAVQRQLQAQLGTIDLKLPDINADDARAQYRALAEAQDLTTESGRKAYAMLLQLAGSFASITDAASSNAEELARIEAERQKKIADTRAGLDERLLAAQGNDRGVLDLRRKQEYDALYKLDPALAALVAQIYALEDASTAAAAAAQQEAEAAARAAEIEASRFDINQRILIAQGNDRGALDLRRRKEYDELYQKDPALAALIAQLYALEDAASAAAAAAQKEAEAAARAAEIESNRSSLQERLLIAGGDERGALDLRRKQEFDALYKLDPALAALVAKIYELEDASRAAADAAARAAEIESKGFDLTQRLLIAEGRDREALDLRRAQEYDALYKLDPALAAMVARIYELEDAASAAAEAERARGNAMRDLADAMGRQREVWESQLEVIDAQRQVQQEALGLITGIFDLVRSNARDLYGEVGATAAMQASQGNAFIAQALATAKRTGYLPEQDALQEAISAARGGLDANNYATQVDADFARLVLAGQLKGLEDIAGPQKTAAEQQLERLDAQTENLQRLIREQQKEYDLLQRQVDIANGTYNATITVAEATAKIIELLGGKKPAGNASGDGGAAWGGSAPTPAGTGSTANQPPAKYNRVFWAGGSAAGYEAITDQSLIDRLDKLAPVYHSFDGTGDLTGLGEAFKQAGGSIADLAILSGNYEADWRNAFAAVGIPAFAVGTNYVPYDTPAVVHKGERIIPAADNRALMAAVNAGGQGNTARLEALVQQLVEDNRLQAGEILRLQNRLAKVIEKWDGDGLPQERDEAVTA